MKISTYRQEAGNSSEISPREATREILACKKNIVKRNLDRNEAKRGFDKAVSESTTFGSDVKRAIQREFYLSKLLENFETPTQFKKKFYEDLEKIEAKSSDELSQDLLDIIKKDEALCITIDSVGSPELLAELGKTEQRKYLTKHGSVMSRRNEIILGAAGVITLLTVAWLHKYDVPIFVLLTEYSIGSALISAALISEAKTLEAKKEDSKAANIEAFLPVLNRMDKLLQWQKRINALSKRQFIDPVAVREEIENLEEYIAMEMRICKALLAKILKEEEAIVEIGNQRITLAEMIASESHEDEEEMAFKHRIIDLEAEGPIDETISDIRRAAETFLQSAQKIDKAITGIFREVKAGIQKELARDFTAERKKWLRENEKPELIMTEFEATEEPKTAIEVTGVRVETAPIEKVIATKIPEGNDETDQADDDAQAAFENAGSEKKAATISANER